MKYSYLSRCHPIAPGGYHPASNIGDPTLPYRSLYPPRIFSGSSSTTLLPSPPPPQPQQPPPYLYPSPSRLTSYSSQYPPHHPSLNDYYVGHVLSGNNTSQYPHHQNLNYMNAPDSNYTCIGAPVGHGFTPSGSGSGGAVGGSGGRDTSLSNQEEGLNWGRSYAAGGTQQQRLDPTPSSINRYQDGF